MLRWTRRLRLMEIDKLIEEGSSRSSQLDKGGVTEAKVEVVSLEDGQSR